MINNKGYIIIYVFLLYCSGQKAFAAEWKSKLFGQFEKIVATCPQGGDTTLIGPPNIYGRYVETSEYKGYVLPYNFARIFFLYNGWMYPSLEWNLSNDDIAMAEMILREKLKEYCIARWSTIPEIFVHMNKFIRQYSGTYMRSYNKPHYLIKIIEIRLVNEMAYRDIEMNHPEYYNDDRVTWKHRIYEMFMEEKLIDQVNIDWNELFVIGVTINITDKSIHDIDYIGYNGF